MLGQGQKFHPVSVSDITEQLSSRFCSSEVFQLTSVISSPWIAHHWVSPCGNPQTCLEHLSHVLIMGARRRSDGGEQTRVAEFMSCFVNFGVLLLFFSQQLV